MNRVAATISSASLLGFLSFAGPAQAVPSPTPAPPGPPVSSGPATPGPLPGPAPAPADPAAPPAAPSAAPPAEPEFDPAAPVVPVLPGSGDPARDACDKFTQAVGIAATSYEAFADASAGSGNYVDYGDPEVARTSVISRAGLRTGAGAALDAANTPGVPPEIADPMRSWSMRATKLIFIIGLRGGGDSLNNAANDMNVDWGNAQAACLAARVRPAG